MDMMNGANDYLKDICKSLVGTYARRVQLEIGNVI